MQGGKRDTDMRSLVRQVFSERAKEPFLTLTLLRRHWPGIVGPELSARTLPRRLEGGTLWIAAPDACWAYELQFFKSELLDSVQTFLDSRSVRDLRFKVDPEALSAAAGAPAGQASAAPQARRPTAPAEPEAPEALERAAATIGDAALRAVFRRSLAKQRWARETQDTEPPGGPPPKAP